MSLLRQLGLGAAALFATAATAQAADVPSMPEPAPYVPPPAYQAPAFTWSGAYIGGLVGYGWANTETEAGDGDGFVAGGFGGYNVQLNNNWVIGGEVDALWSGIDGAEGTTSADVNWMSTVRARAGYAMDNVLLYGTGGIAFANAEASSGGVSDSNTHIGWTAGVGADLAMTDNVFGRLEYQYADFGSETYNIGGGVDADLTTSIVRAGIGLKF